MAFGTNVLPKKPRTPRPVAPPGAANQAGDMMPVTPAVPGVGELVGQFKEQGAAARAANEARYAQGMGIHEQLVGDFGQGGTLQTAMMGQYQRQKERDLASQKQHMIGSGLMNTTIAAGMPAAYEEQVGTPYKMQMADLMAQRQAGAMQGQAGFIERREDTPPSPELMASLVQTASARPEDVTGATAADGTPTTSTEIAAGGVPSMADVASQHAFTPPAGKSTSRTMPGFASSGSGWGGGGSGLGDFDTFTTGGSGATVREPGKGSGSGVAAKDLTVPSDKKAPTVEKRYMGLNNKWMVSLSDGTKMTADAYNKARRQGKSVGGALASTAGEILAPDAQTGANVGAALGGAAGAALGPLGSAAGSLVGSLAGTYFGKK